MGIGIGAAVAAAAAMGDSGSDGDGDSDSGIGGEEREFSHYLKAAEAAAVCKPLMAPREQQDAGLIGLPLPLGQISRTAA